MDTIERPGKVFFAFTMDCERIAEESTLKNGTPSWEISEKAILGMAEVLREKDVVRGGAFYPTPATAARHRDLFRDLKADGFDLGCQFHCDSFRSGEYSRFLGEYPYARQKEILTFAKQDWEEALEAPMTTFRCGFLSANDFTFPILAELGVRQSSSSMPRRHLPELAARWVGVHPYPHHASAKSRLVCGDLPLFEVPIAVHPFKWANPEHTVAPDLRPDRGLEPAFYEDIIRSWLENMLRADPPIKTIVAITHNTIDYLDRQNPKRKIMELEIDCIRQAVTESGHQFVPATLQDIRREADRIGSY